MMMKKYISIFTLALLFIILPFVSVKAVEPLNGEQKKAFTSQIQEKKNAIQEKTLAVKKIQPQFDDMANDMLKTFENILNAETVLREDFANKVQPKYEQFFNDLTNIGKLENDIKIKKLEAKVNTDKGNYSQALLDYDIVFKLLDKEEALLKHNSTQMQESVELIKSIQYK
jgi:hypothetical protein